ncbi:hypothetical protein DSO57_1018167 [Entomophthora muscae]|uniref:Uncharacterized protein n=1 Tax=Entomophthora muscae TaxID=34485 RepID=A0ACC2TF25_9FUNG|nr:hypothetical protein DSO57_1018167 [Entomophthora muscae]
MNQGQLWKVLHSVRNIPDTYSCVINKLSPAANVKAPASTKQTSTINVQTSPSQQHATNNICCHKADTHCHHAEARHIKQSPSVSMQAPAATKKTSTSTVRAPAVHTQNPVTTKPLPAVNLQAPATKQVSAATVQAPTTTTTQKPVTTKTLPAVNVQAPTATKQVSAATAQAPAATKQMSTATARAPATSTQKPATTKLLPSANTQVLAAIKQMPTVTAQVPTTLASPTCKPSSNQAPMGQPATCQPLPSHASRPVPIYSFGK